MVYERVFTDKRCANCRNANANHPRVVNFRGFAYCEVIRKTVYLWQHVRNMPCEGGRGWQPREVQSELLN